MFEFLTALLHSLLKLLVSNRKDLLLTLMVLKKENPIYKRHINQLTIEKPSTLLDWQRKFRNNHWTYKHSKPGRKPVSKDVKELILQLKRDNSLWGCHRISDELKRIGIELNPTTVNRIIQVYRKQGRIQPEGSWKKFLKSHWESLYAMDFITIDTLFGKRLNLLIILELKSRKIIRSDLTENPCREFVKQQIELFSEEISGKKTLIHDNAALGGIPAGNQSTGFGEIKKEPVLGSLYHHYYRSSA